MPSNPTRVARRKKALKPRFTVHDRLPTEDPDAARDVAIIAKRAAALDKSARTCISALLDRLEQLAGRPLGGLLFRELEETGQHRKRCLIEVRKGYDEAEGEGSDLGVRLSETGEQLPMFPTED
jgi:hypothetical protein